MLHRNKTLGVGCILGINTYRIQNYDDQKRLQLCKHTKQDDAQLSDEERFSLEWILGNIFSGAPFKVSEYDYNDSKSGVIGYWHVSLKDTSHNP